MLLRIMFSKSSCATENSASNRAKLILEHPLRQTLARSDCEVASSRRRSRLPKNKISLKFPSVKRKKVVVVVAVVVVVIVVIVVVVAAVMKIEKYW